MADEKLKTKRLQVQKGTDEINQDGVSYKPSVGGEKPDWQVDVPPQVAEHIVRQGGAVEIVNEVTPSTNEVFYTHPQKIGFHWNGRSYEPDGMGRIKAPVEAFEHVEPHGFKIVED